MTEIYHVAVKLDVTYWRAHMLEIVYPKTNDSQRNGCLITHTDEPLTACFIAYVWQLNR